MPLFFSSCRGISEYLNIDLNIKASIEHQITQNTLTEGSDPYNLVIKLNTKADKKIDLEIEYSGTYLPSDFTSLPASVTFNKGEKEKIIQLPLTDDSIFEPNKTLSLKLKADSDIAITNPDHEFTLIDNEIIYSYAMVTSNVNEGSSLNYTIYLFDEDYNPLTLNFDLILNLKNSTGTYPASELTAGTYETLTIPAGQDRLVGTIGTTNNTTNDGFRTLELEYEGNAAVDDVYPITFMSNIIDDDFPIVGVSNVNCSGINEATATCNIQFNRLISTASPITVNVSYSGAATRGVDYNAPLSATIPAGATTVTVPVTIINDTTLEMNETVIVTVEPHADYNIHPFRSPMTFSIVDNDSTPESRSVELSAIVSDSPPSITLTWTESVTGLDYTLLRKELGANAWGTPITVAAPAQSYVDTQVEVGKVYEYKITREMNGQGYLSATIKRPYVHSRGDLLVVVESTLNTSISTELDGWYRTLAGDGWDVSSINVLASDSVSSVKAKIAQKYQDLPNLKTVLLVGHVPVPYSGNLAPDGITSHVGAWPADAYYADLDGTWTDTSVNNTSASRTANRNIPGDGKFDQSNIPSTIELAIGRVDLSNLTSFALSEANLTRRYITKNTNYRNATFAVNRRALVDDTFGDFSTGEAFASAPRNWFGSLVGAGNTFTLDWFTTLQTNHYMWAYGAGASGYTDIGGVGNATDFATKTINAIFTATFGSNFGDWDNTNNSLRAVIASAGTTLTNVYSGRPNWLFHTLSVGEPMNTSIFLSQRNHNNLYYPTTVGSNQIHTGFMGDPTLRDRMVAPLTNLVPTDNGADVTLDWTASPDAGVETYFIYGSNDPIKGYTLITSVPAATHQYILSKPLTYSYYQIRAGKLDTSLTGTYYNLSTGVILDATGF